MSYELSRCLVRFRFVKKKVTERFVLKRSKHLFDGCKPKWTEVKRTLIKHTLVYKSGIYPLSRNNCILSGTWYRTTIEFYEYTHSTHMVGNTVTYLELVTTPLYDFTNWLPTNERYWCRTVGTLDQGLTLVTHGSLTVHLFLFLKDILIDPEQKSEYHYHGITKFTSSKRVSIGSSWS